MKNKIFSCYIIIHPKTEKNNIFNKKVENIVNFFVELKIRYYL